MEKSEVPFEKKIFVCTNGNAGKNGCCGARQGVEIFQALRAIAKDRGVHPRIRVAQATCLGQCARGVNVMVFPGNEWYSAVTPDDVAQIAEAHIPAAGE
ncbi:MAG: (2Fe-2S) ferredoxin domain-containing protein [Candidatus Omnitrophica bacterium]|nr:(2Fe-2S) ferredoxin domain-containing protein [Candidatus Omnitrophota bacterium]MCB9722302.1 (2Fe-2S) ferredoxin domain-containing protein [Candidatus Omnitrophota bacterium]